MKNIYVDFLSAKCGIQNTFRQVVVLNHRGYIQIFKTNHAIRIDKLST